MAAVTRKRGGSIVDQQLADAAAEAPHGGSPRLSTLRTGSSSAMRVCGFALERRELGLVLSVLVLHTAVTGA
jgi:hypothetical protein